MLEETQKIVIDVIDYGKGFKQQDLPNSNSRGLNNMRYRAEQIGADLIIASSEHGTQIRLVMAY